MTPTQALQKRLMESDPKYVREFVLYMVETVQDEVRTQGLPSSFLERFAFLALYQQMCCVTQDSIRLWMRKWDDLLKEYAEYPAVVAFVHELEEGFFTE